MLFVSSLFAANASILDFTKIQFWLHYRDVNHSFPRLSIFLVLVLKKPCSTDDRCNTSNENIFPIPDQITSFCMERVSDENYGIHFVWRLRTDIAMTGQKRTEQNDGREFVLLYSYCSAHGDLHFNCILDLFFPKQKYAMKIILF